jgi:ABC-type glutathione transport system ATPase component
MWRASHGWLRRSDGAIAAAPSITLGATLDAVSHARRAAGDAAPDFPARDATPDVRLVDLTRRFGEVTAVDAVSLDVGRGEFFTLLGPSGSGKSTTLRLIAGFEQPDGGRVELAGADVSRRPPYARDVNTVFQDYALFPHMTVHENVEYGLRVRKVARGERRPRAEEALRMVRLEGYGGRKPAQLSGGQASAWRWRARSSTARRCCCSTSRSAPWTSSCARRCRSSSSASRPRSASLSSTSRTTRRRR